MPSRPGHTAAADVTTMEDSPMDTKYLQLSKQLAHTEKKQRDKAARSIRQSLTNTKHQITRLDMLKLWKGLFYCKCYLPEYYLYMIL